MVKFLNQKEQVLEVELTTYGKQKYSEGKFKPQFYAFFDDGIIYDGQYGGITENQNKIVDRIKNRTPRFGLSAKHQTSESRGPEEGFEVFNPFDQATDANSTYYRFLGSNSPWSDNAPAWSISVLQGSDSRLEGPVKYFLQGAVPRVSASLEIEYQDVAEPQEGNLWRLVKNQKLLLDVQELNTIFKANGNYDIEVFKISRRQKTDGTTEEMLQRLKFINENSLNNSILQSQRNRYNLLSTLAGTNRDIEFNFPVLTNEYVEFYFDLAVDLEIQADAIVPSSTFYKQRTTTVSGDICAVASFGIAQDAPQGGDV
tara:strand:- start:511 stop:1452 length:942 start_codon:yes stop_codon:yes gene_type:complete